MKILTEDLLLLNSISGFGYKKLKELFDKFGEDTSAAVSSYNPSAFNIKNINDELKLIKEKGVSVITTFDTQYPAALKEISSPPIVLYVKGGLSSICAETVAIVGARNCTYYGRKMAKDLSSMFSKLGVTIVSGMARGIDTVAHKEAIEAGGKTIAVLGSGLNCIYPPENEKLAEQIALNGALISEFAMNTPPLKENFPRRNRVISGLSRGTVVVEASLKSGALITADFALEQGRDVFAVPANADAASFKGCNNLIRQGAKITCSASDVIEELFPELLKDANDTDCNPEDKIKTLNIAVEDKRVYLLLKNEPVDLDSLIEEAGLNSQTVLSSLLQLELAGLARQLPGKLFVRK